MSRWPKLCGGDARRPAAGELEDKLFAFRAMLSSVLGSKHRDYRKLRVRATREELAELEALDDGVDADEPLQPPVVEADGRESLSPTGRSGAG